MAMDVTNNNSQGPQWPDYSVIATVLLISASIGIYYRFSGVRQQTAEEYFSANRSMNIPLLSIAMMVAYLSAIELLGTSGESYIHGAHYVIIIVGYLLGTPITAFFYLPVFFKLQNMSIYGYLKKRFGPVAQLLASVANFIQCGLYTGVVLYGPALTVEATTGLSSISSILLIGLICTFYSSIGGMKAVLATEVFQGFLMFASVFCVIVVVCSDIEGGISEVWDTAVKDGRLWVSNFDVDPTVRHTWWSLTIGGTFYFLAHFGVNQIQVQRLLSAKSLKSAQIALFITTPIINFLVLLTAFSGLVLYAWFKGCDPVAAGHISSYDQVMPYFAKMRLSKIPGLLGFFIAGVFSAALSTVSVMLNSLTAIAIADFVKPLYWKIGREFPDSNAAFFGKFLCVVNGLLCIAIAFSASGYSSLLQTALSVNGAIGGPVLGLFNLGMFVETANEKGAVIGTIIGLAFSVWMTFGSPEPPVSNLSVSVDECLNTTYSTSPTSYDYMHGSTNAEDTDYFYLHRLSYMWLTPFGMITTMLFGYIASTVVRCFSKNLITERDPDLFTPILASRIKRRYVKTSSPQVFVLTTKEFDS